MSGLAAADGTSADGACVSPGGAPAPVPAGATAPARVRSAALRATWMTAIAGAGAVVLALLGTGFRYEPLEAPASPDAAGATPLHQERDRLRAQLARRTPRGSWLAIDQTHNRLRLMRGDRVVLEAPCSAGSGMVLREGQGGRVWTFDTPRGAFRVRTRLRNPVWRKPDWAFVEEGRPIPEDPGERFEYGVLGEYALYFGDGYMVHGTLYERLIGRPVSHGCIRVGREPLRRLWEALPVDAPIYIY